MVAARFQGNAFAFSNLQTAGNSLHFHTHGFLAGFRVFDFGMNVLVDFDAFRSGAGTADQYDVFGSIVFQFHKHAAVFHTANGFARPWALCLHACGKRGLTCGSSGYECKYFLHNAFLSQHG